MNPRATGEVPGGENSDNDENRKSRGQIRSRASSKLAQRSGPFLKQEPPLPKMKKLCRWAEVARSTQQTYSRVMTNERPPDHKPAPQEETSEQILREEAGPHEFDQLDPEQKKAFNWVIERIGHALSHRSPRDAPETLRVPAFMETRHSRVLFVGGARGAGKTTLLLSLMKSFAASVTRPLLCLPAGMASRVVWLSPLDMEDLPESANLLATLLVRVEEILTRFGVGSGATGEDRSRQSQGGWFAAHDSVFAKLDSLGNAAALAWNRRFSPQQSSGLEPEAYATEVRKAEHARMDLNSRMYSLFEDLSRSLGVHPQVAANPLFILPVDDFDLNPLRSLELLQLLRTVTIPSLLVIILGNRRLAEGMLRLREMGELSREASPHGGPLLKDAALYIRRAGPHIAASAVRKLCPPAQSFWMSNSVTHLDKRLEGLLGKDKPPQGPVLNDERHFHDLITHFMQWPHPFRGGNATFRDLFVSRLVDWDSDTSGPGLILNRYAGRMAFKASHRHLIDMHEQARFTLLKLRDEKKNELVDRRQALGRLILDWTIEAIWEDDHLLQSEREELAEQLKEISLAFSSGRPRMWPLTFHMRRGKSIDLAGAGARLAVRSTFDWHNYIRYYGNPKYSREKEQIESSHERRLRRTFDEKGYTRKRKVARCGERLLGLLTLCRDLNSGLADAHPRISRAEHIVWAQWPLGATRRVSIPWPMPEYSTLFEYETLAQLVVRWVGAKGKSSEESRDAESSGCAADRSQGGTSLPVAGEVTTNQPATNFGPAKSVETCGSGEAKSVGGVSLELGLRWPLVTLLAFQHKTGQCDESRIKMPTTSCEAAFRKQFGETIEKVCLTQTSVDDESELKFLRSWLVATLVAACPESAAMGPVATWMLDELKSRTTRLGDGWAKVVGEVQRRRAVHFSQFVAARARDYGLALIAPWRLVYSLALVVEENAECKVFKDAIDSWAPTDGDPWGDPDKWSEKELRLQQFTRSAVFVNDKARSKLQKVLVAMKKKDGELSWRDIAHLLEVCVKSLTHPLHRFIRQNGCSNVKESRELSALISSHVYPIEGAGSPWTMPALCPGRSDLGRDSFPHLETLAWRAGLGGEDLNNGEDSTRPNVVNMSAESVGAVKTQS